MLIPICTGISKNLTLLDLMLTAIKRHTQHAFNRNEWVQLALLQYLNYDRFCGNIILSHVQSWKEIFRVREGKYPSTSHYVMLLYISTKRSTMLSYISSRNPIRTLILKWSLHASLKIGNLCLYHEKLVNNNYIHMW